MIDASYLINYINFVYSKSCFSKDNSLDLNTEPLVHNTINILKLGVDDLDLDKSNLNLGLS